MKKSILLALGIFIITAGILSFVFKDKLFPNVKLPDLKIPSPNLAGTATIVKINYISYDGEDGKTALELLTRNHQVKTQISSLGTLVQSIDGVKNTNQDFWMFYIDQVLADTGADQLVTKNGEKIEWKYQSIK